MSSFSSMWYGKEIGVLGEITLTSFLYYGHDVTLYLYEKSIKVPKGVNVKSANEIVDESLIFNKHSPSSFSDYFRLKLMEKYNTTWIDMDLVCLSEKWEEPDYLWAKAKSILPATANNAVFRMPKCEALTYMIEKIESSDKNIQYGVEFGPFLLQEAIDKFNLDSYSKDSSEFYPIFWPEAFMANNESLKNEVFKRIKKNTKCFHFWESKMWELSNKKPNEIEPGSYLDWCYNKFVLGNSNG